MYSYLTDNDYYDKKGKSTKKCIIKEEIKFKDYKITKKQIDLKMK